MWRVRDSAGTTIHTPYSIPRSCAVPVDAWNRTAFGVYYTQSSHYGFIGLIRLQRREAEGSPREKRVISHRGRCEIRESGFSFSHSTRVYVKLTVKAKMCVKCPTATHNPWASIRPHAPWIEPPDPSAAPPLSCEMVSNICEMQSESAERLHPCSISGTDTTVATCGELLSPRSPVEIEPGSAAKSSRSIAQRVTRHSRGVPPLGL